MTNKMGKKIQSERIARERDFHDQVFDDGGRKSVSKFYTIARSAHSHYAALTLKESQGKKALELGCGLHSLAYQLAQQGADATGIDISPVAIKQAQSIAAEKKLSCSFLEMNAEETTFDDNSFDIICGSGILHHLNLDKAYAELSRILKPSGRAVFVEPMGHNWFIELYRRSTPNLRTEDEHPLLEDDISHASEHFKNVRRHHYVLFTLPMFPFRNFRIFEKLVATIESVDRAIFRRFPSMRKYSWILVLELEN